MGLKVVPSVVDLAGPAADEVEHGGMLAECSRRCFQSVEAR
jgi:hypothetical protein